ncbi:carboxymuconolactone decarboxylase family protein [Oscillochloris sp. ZM17-4]|nr:carboxymuconolactone decarboxylase family protein [Oscillochloris sp. ZM17-4]
MAFIAYVPPEQLAEAERVKDPDNIIQIHSAHPATMRHHYDLYVELMHRRSPLTRVQREMIAVTISALNHCHY